jgi:uncharacterized Tic20 family protein
VSLDDRRWAAAAHVGSLLAAWFALGVLGPLAVLVLRGDTSPFVRRHAVESLNFQISLLIYIAVAGVAAVFTVGLALLVLIPVGFVIALVALIEIILGTAAANRGDEFRYPLCIRLVR